MGFLTSHKHHNGQSKPESDRCKVYVFARASGIVPAHGEGSIEPDIQWSLAVQSPKFQEALQPMEVKKSKSLFGSMRKGSKTEVTAKDEPLKAPGSSNENTATEFKLAAGNLNISHSSTALQDDKNMNGNQDGTSDDAHRQRSTSGPLSILLKIHLKHHPQTPLGNQTLPVKIEQILQQMTAANSTLRDHQSETWIKYALISLQHANILPHGHAFNVNNLINFAQNKTTEFEAEAMSASSHHHHSISDDGSEQLVKELDYQTHLDENARLRALFGQSLPDSFDDDDGSRRSSARFTDGSKRSSRDMSHAHHHHHHQGNGGFWVSHPHHHQQQRYGQRSDPYGGLM